MRALTIAALLILLTGCMGGARSTIAARGAEAADQGLHDAEWYLCHASPVGAVKRRYGASEDRAEAYRTLCAAGTDAPVIQADD